MSKLGFLVAVSVVSLGAAVGAWYYKYQLYGWLPSTGVSGFLCLGRLFQGQPNEAALCI